MSNSNITSVVAVVPVKDHARAVAWYQQLFGRAADVEPAPGVAEWQLANSAWIQVSQDDAEHAGSATVVVGVHDLEIQNEACREAGIKPGDVNDYGVVRTAEVVDPDGNRIVYAQEVIQT